MTFDISKRKDFCTQLHRLQTETEKPSKMDSLASNLSRPYRRNPCRLLRSILRTILCTCQLGQLQWIPGCTLVFLTKEAKTVHQVRTAKIFRTGRSSSPIMALYSLLRHFENGSNPSDATKYSAYPDIRSPKDWQKLYPHVETINQSRHFHHKLELFASSHRHFSPSITNSHIYNTTTANLLHSYLKGKIYVP